MHRIGIRLGILCLALVSVSGCAGPDATTVDLRTPPVRDVATDPGGLTASTGLGQGAGIGADGLASE